ncbi:DNA recombination protein RmuC [Ferruginibacter yonginensis]|uniref:DNA recombination protein RmuC n=1 Tax=Ferruginibacter yonginensis TaxID=1310416 RepID=A0ABV8QS11_9BACT
MNNILILIITSAILLIVVIVIIRLLYAQKTNFIKAQLLQSQQQLEQLNKAHQQLQNSEAALQISKANSEAQVQFLQDEVHQLKIIATQYQQLLQKNAITETQLQQTAQQLATQQQEVQQLNNTLQLQFKHVAQAILDEKTNQFTAVNEQKMTAILAPLKQQLQEFKQKVEETYDKESKERFSLHKEVGRLIDMTQQVSQDANNLTNALKGNNKIQGNWGELILESILEASGLLKGTQYFLQQFIKDNAGNIIKDEDGKGLQPDVMIVYPDERKIIIDAKVSLQAWDILVAATDITEQHTYLAQHLKSIKNHIDGLSKKNYPKYASALEYVLLFIPIEPAFLEALKQDATLWKYAYDRNIILVSPTNLLAVLKIIVALWKVSSQSKNAIEIAEKAGSLYDKFVGFYESFDAVGKKIREAHQSFEQAQKQLITGRGNFTQKVEELKKMGANAQKQLPDAALNNDQ